MQNQTPNETPAPPETDPLDAASGLTEQEQQEIRAHIEAVAGENRIPVGSDAFRLAGASRGFALPLAVLCVTLVLVAGSVVTMHRLFTRDERLIRQTAGEFVSVEGRLIRALREESRDQLNAKQREISTIRSRLAQLEAEQAALEADFDQRIAAREAEIREELEREIVAERSRLIAQGLGSAEIDRLMEQFETERRAFYEQQLQEYRAQLEAERSAIQVNIDTLRVQFRSQIEALEQEREALREEFLLRERELRAELQERTRRAALEDPAASAAAAVAARELADLSARAEQERVLEQQVVGQLDRVRETVAEGRWAEARSAIQSARVLLNDPVYTRLRAISARRETDLFLLQQLELVIDQQEEIAAADALSPLPILGDASAVLGEAGTAAELFDQVEFYRQSVAAAQQRLQELAAEANATQLELQEQIADLARFQQQVATAQQRYRAFVATVRSARAGGAPDQASLVARQELDDLLRSDIFLSLFEELSDEVSSLFAAVQTAGSDAALAEAADVVT
ncbi:MAG: hypothetical protein EA403_01020, partial [Spirochaetaceae bacterium]